MNTHDSDLQEESVFSDKAGCHLEIMLKSHSFPSEPQIQEAGPSLHLSNISFRLFGKESLQSTV